MNLKIIFSLSFLFLSCLAFSQTTKSVVLPWEYIGGPPANINDISVQGDTVFAATDRGAFFRVEQGGWQEFKAFEGLHCKQIAVIDSVVMVGTERDTFIYFNGFPAQRAIIEAWRSVDYGASIVKRIFYFVNWRTHPESPYISKFQLKVHGSDVFGMSSERYYYGPQVFDSYSYDLGESWHLPSYHSSEPIQLQQAANGIFQAQGDSLAFLRLDCLMVNKVGDSLDSGRIDSVPLPNLPFGWVAGTSDFLWKGDTMLVSKNGWFSLSVDRGKTWTATDDLLANRFEDGKWYFVDRQGIRSMQTYRVDTTMRYTIPYFSKSLKKALRTGAAWWLLAEDGLLYRLEDDKNGAEIQNNGLISAKGTISRLGDGFVFNTGTTLYRSDDMEQWDLWTDAGKINALEYYDFIQHKGVTLIATSNGIFRLDTSGNWQNVLVADSNPAKFTESQDGNSVHYRNFSSTDSGLTWTKIHNFPYNTTFANGNILVGKDYSDAYFLTTDMGISWQSLQGQGIIGNTLISLGYGEHTYGFDLGQHPVSYPNQISFPIQPISVFDSLVWIKLSHFDNQIRFLKFPDSTVYACPVPPFVSDEPAHSTLVKTQYSFGSSLQEKDYIFAANNGGVFRVHRCAIENPPIIDTLSLCNGISYLFYGDSISQTGYQFHLFSDSSDCPIYDAVYFDFYDIKTSQTVTICQGQSHVWNGITYELAGSYKQYFTTAEGCDSTVTLSLKVDLLNSSEEVKLCEGDTLVWNGIPYFEAGIYEQNFVTHLGCDSLSRLYLSFQKSDYQDFKYLCKDSVLNYFGFQIDSEGLYDFPYISALGCDSTVHLTVEDYPIDTIVYSNFSMCANDSFLYLGNTFHAPGNYTFWYLPSYESCPHFYDITIQAKPQDSIQIDTVLATGTTLFGQTIFSDTVFTTYLPASGGKCDTVVQISALVTSSTKDAFDEEGLSVYPQPTRDVLFLTKTKGEIGQWILTNNQGQVVLQGYLAGGSGHISLQHLPEGLYFLELKNQGNAFREKVLVQRL